MPSKSKKQANFMRAACHDKEGDYKISKKDACEFAKADSKKNEDIDEADIIDEIVEAFKKMK